MIYLQGLLLLMVLASCGYLAFAWLMASHFLAGVKRHTDGQRGSGRAGRESLSRCWPSVSQIKPIHLANDRALDLWRSFAEQDYPGVQEVILAVGDLRAPVLPLAQELKRTVHFSQPGHCLRLSIGAVAGCNRKIATCIPAVAQAENDIIVLSDADMQAEPWLLRRVTQPFGDPKVGVVTSLYIVREVESWGSALEGLSVLDFCASVLVARKYEGLSYAFGAVMAVRREVLEKIGGPEAFKDYLADDYQLGNQATALGYNVALMDGMVTDWVGKETFAGFFSHQLRWMRTYRVSRPGGHLAFLVTQGLVWSLLLLVASQFSVLGWSVLGAWCLFRSLWTFFMWRRLSEQAPASLWGLLACVKDLVYLVLWLLSLFGNTVRWGDKLYRVRKDGKMQEIRNLQGH